MDFRWLNVWTRPYDQHYDENLFYNKTGYKEVMESFKKGLPDEKTKIAMLNAVQAVVEEYQDDVDLTLIRFPENYMTLLKNNVR